MRDMKTLLINHCICFYVLFPFAIFHSQLSSIASAENFICNDAIVINAAEQARLRSARFWSGNPLPGNWSYPCVITCQIRPHEGGGQTQFRFAGGEVFDWRMTVTGSRESIFRDVIPHEVDHMVRASLIRHPIERWLDEGCASLMESSASHQRLRQGAALLPQDLFSQEWLEQRDYPQSSIELEQLYAGGFSLVEFLLTKGTPRTLLQFQRDSDSVTSRLARYYQLNPLQLQTEWHTWRRTEHHVDCIRKRCLIHGSFQSPQSQLRPRLTVLTTDGCAPCLQFWNDYQTMDLFRHQLDRHFDVHIDKNNVRSDSSMKITANVFPTFIFNEQRIEGYIGPEHLLNQLGIPLQEFPESFPSGPSPGLVFPSSSSNPVLEEPIVSMDSVTPASQATSSTTWVDRILRGLPVSLAALQYIGIIGGSLATGGIGSLAVSAFIAARCRRRTLQLRKQGGLIERSAAEIPAPFPRQLDEARQLLEIRQSEGRVAVLDAIRGLFLDDELEKLEQSGDSAKEGMARNLRESIDARVAEVAPLTIRI
ncbi:MAG TPA: hypothetical protein VNQ76_16875 [Planctomicrobium sp.]|nr:hypothetical protein [Planctomicrobium sp.]